MLTGTGSSALVAERGLDWLIAHADELRPAWGAERWSRGDRSMVAATEATIGSWLAGAICGLPGQGDELRRRVRRSAGPELLAGFATSPPTWFRPLLAMAGAIRASGDSWPEAEAAVRSRLPEAMARCGELRVDQVLEVRYWLARLDLLPVPYETSLADMVRGEIDSATRGSVVAHGHIDAEAAYRLTHLVFYATGFGAIDIELAGAASAVARLACSAVARGDVDLLAEAVIAAHALGVPSGQESGELARVFASAQTPSGALRPHLAREPTNAGDEIEDCYHSTIVGSVAAGILASDRDL